MTMSTLIIEAQTCFQFKANFLPCTILQIEHDDLATLEQQLVTTIRRTPNFFIGSPVVIDLNKVKTLELLNFGHLKQILVASGMIPIGVRGGSEQQQQAAVKDGLPILSSKSSISDLSKKKKDEPPHATKLIATPIRSGMQVYAKESDLIVTAAVSPGAELFADGNIHVYGPLRGRALAGVQGNMQARIFCRALQAELISIAGYYLTKEDMQTVSQEEGMVQIYLEKAQVRIEAIQ